MLYDDSYPRFTLENLPEMQAVLDGTDYTNLKLSADVQMRLESHVNTLILFPDSSGSDDTPFYIQGQGNVNIALLGIMQLADSDPNPVRKIILNGMLADFDAQLALLLDEC